MNSAITFEQCEQNQIIRVDNDKASARISLYGAHVLSFKPKSDNRERLWMSPQSKTDGTGAIRGGVPICWPWFADQFPIGQETIPNLSMHGLVRTKLWALSACEELSDGGQKLTFATEVNYETGFPFQAKLKYEVSISDTLSLKLIVENIGEVTFPFTGALHTYFATEDVDNTEVSGLTTQFKDKNRDFQVFDTPEAYITQSPLDAVHLEPASSLSLHSASFKTQIDASGHDSIVVWNPGSEGVKSINNIPDPAYQHFLCVEAAITQSPVEVAPGMSHSLSQLIT